MLVDINLLPEKKRKRLPALVPVLFVLLLVSGGMGAFLWGQAQKNELELAESRLKSAVQLRETLETNINKSKDNEEDIKVLMNAIQWAEGRRIEMVPVLEHLVSLLPERGFFLEFSYTNHETIILLVQFDTSRQAAYYLSELEASEWINNAQLINLATLVEEDNAKQLLEDINALPRYQVQYELTLDEAAILQQQKDRLNYQEDHP